jgi:hypothetical protein
MVESILLWICGAMLGLYLSGVLSRSLVAMLATQGNPFFLDLTPDRKVVAFAVVLATTTCLLFGLIPAWRATRLVAADACEVRVVEWSVTSGASDCAKSSLSPKSRCRLYRSLELSCFRAAFASS